MAMTPYSEDTSVIGKLGTTPQERGLETQEFKDKFDEGLKAFVEWFNLTHKTEFEAVQTDLATHKADYTEDKADNIYMYRASLEDANLNIIGDFGCYRLIGGNSNVPPGFNGYGLMMVNYAYGGYVAQEIIEVGSSKKWVRSTTASRPIVKAGDATWQPWQRIYTSIEIPEGTGSPEGVVEASVGTLYRRIDVGELYVKITGTGNTGWGKVVTE